MISNSAEYVLKKIRKKDPVAYSRIFSKIAEIANDPRRGKPLRNKMKTIWEVHIGSFILLYTIDLERKEIVIQDYVHKDRAYER